MMYAHVTTYRGRAMTRQYRVSIPWRSGFDATFDDVETALRTWAAMAGGRPGDSVSVQCWDAAGNMTRDGNLVHVSDVDGQPKVYVNPRIWQEDA